MANNTLITSDLERMVRQILNSGEKEVLETQDPRSDINNLFRITKWAASGGIDEEGLSRH